MPLLLILALLAAPTAPGPDEDRDLLADATENRLVAKFLPRFFISQNDCDALPSEFKPHLQHPQSLHRNGTLYAQAFPVPQGIEIHYYHLWANDCGPLGHPLDAEHVAVLIDSQTEQAIAWFAAAHQNTPCDAGTGARADVLNAVDQGPLVYISRGKHASYFSPKSCEAGCNGDRCDQPVPYKPTRILNLGEPNAPLNGATWALSPRWNLQEKMVPELTPAILDLLRGQRGIATISRTPGAVVSVLGAGNIAINETGEALQTGQSHTRNSLKRAKESTRNFFRRLGLP